MRGFFFISKKRFKKIFWMAVLVFAIFSWQFFTQNLTIPILGRQTRLVPIYYVDTTEKKMAISFDACWGGSTLLRSI